MFLPSFWGSWVSSLSGNGSHLEGGADLAAGRLWFFSSVAVKITPTHPLISHPTHPLAYPLRHAALIYATLPPTHLACMPHNGFCCLICSHGNYPLHMALSKIGLTELSYWKDADTDGSFRRVREGHAYRQSPRRRSGYMGWRGSFRWEDENKIKTVNHAKGECIWWPSSGAKDHRRRLWILQHSVISKAGKFSRS